MMGKYEFEQFLTHLATHRHVSASTQNQAFNALMFLYNQVLELPLVDQNINALRAKQRVCPLFFVLVFAELNLWFQNH